MLVKLTRERLTSLGWRNQGWSGDLPTPEAQGFIGGGFAEALEPMRDIAQDDNRDVAAINAHAKRKNLTADMRGIVTR